MSITEARKLAKYHSFTKSELYNILKDALENLPESYWSKANKINPIFDNGYYFNLCRKWLAYEVGKDDNQKSKEIVVVRVLQGFGKYSKVQLPKKKKPNTKIMKSEKPKL